MTDLASQFPRSLHIIRWLALIEFYRGDEARSILLFEKLRAIDPFVSQNLDVYAFLLRRRGNIKALNLSVPFSSCAILSPSRLCHDLMLASPHASETWTAVGIYAEGRHFFDKAVAHFDRVRPSNPPVPHPLGPRS